MIFKEQLTNISTVLNNTGNTTKLLTSFSALDASQQKVLLSSKLLTEEQKEQCIVMSMLSSANTKYTAEQLSKTAGISAETLANWGLTSSTDTLTISELAEKAATDAQAKSALKKIVAQNAQAVANGKLTASNVALTASETGTTLATGAFTTAIKANISAMKTWLLTTPVGWITMLVGGIFLAVKAYDALTVSVEEQKEKMEDSLSAYNDAKSELENITTELDNQKQAMDELLGKEKLTYAEKGQLEELQQITEELRIQKDLAEKEESRVQKEVATDTAALFKKQFGEYDISNEAINEYQTKAKVDDDNIILTSDENDISAMIAGYRQYNDLLNEAYGEKNQKNIDWFTSITEDLKDNIFSTAQDLQTQQDNMSDYYNTIKDIPYDELTGDPKEVVDAYTAISNAIALIYKELDPNSWNEMQIDKLFTTAGIEKTKDELVEMAKKGTLDENTIKSYSKLNSTLEDSNMILNDGQSAASALCDEMYALADAEDDVQSSTLNESPNLLSITDTVDAVNTKLKPSLDSLKTVYQSIFSSDGFTLENVDVSMLESLRKSFADLKKKGIDIATEDFENFTRVITDSSTDSTLAQQAFDDLATTLVENSDVTLVSDDAFNTLVQTLEQLGIINAEDALQGLKEVQDEIASKGYDLANITAEQANQFINEANASEFAVEYLRYYMIQKQLAEQPLNTAEDVKALESLCDSLGITGEMYQTVISLKHSLSAVESGAPIEAFQSSIDNAKKRIAELAKGDYEFGFKFKPELKDSKSSAKNVANEFKNLLDAELKVLDTKMDAGLINFNDYIAQRLDLIQKYYDEGKIKASDYYDYLSKHYETQLSYMDKATSYITTRIDKEIQKYNEQINQIKDKYQTEIDYLDTVIDYYEKQKTALQDANTERELQLALQKALYDLEKAQTQRTKKLYTDNYGYIYRADGDAIRDAQGNVNKAKLDVQINEIDKAIKKVQEQQDALKKSMDREVDAINKIIDNLEGYKDQWNSVAKEYEERQNELIAQQILGADIEKQILAGRLDVLEDFKNKYLSIQQAIKDANANAAQATLSEANKPSGNNGNSGSVSQSVSNKALSSSDALKKKKKSSGGGLRGSSTNKLQLSAYASGTKNAKPGYHEVAENGDEIIRDNQGNAFIAKGHQLHDFEGGETVYSASETRELLDGELTPVENLPDLSESLKNLLKCAKNPSLIQSQFLRPNIPDYNLLKNIEGISTNNQVYVTQNVNVTLPNVTNESGFNNFKKELDRLKLDAYQFANKRNK